MKKERLQELLKGSVKLPEGVDIEQVEFDVDGLHQEVNDFANGLVKNKSEESYSKGQQELLKKHGFESAEDLEKAIQREDEGSEKEKALQELQTKVESLENNLQEKEKALQTKEQQDYLKELGIRNDRVDKAHKLITSDLGEDDKFEDVATKFKEEYPEWVQQNQPRNTGSDKDGEGGTAKSDVDTMKEAWK